MPSPATVQERRVCEFFDGPTGPANLEELVFFAERRIRRGAWCVKRVDGSIPGGKLAEDVVHTVIEAILRPPGSKGFRRVPDTVPIDVAIRQIVRSYINHALLSAENVTRVELPETENGEIFEGAESFWSACEHDATDEDKKHAAARCEAFLALAKKRSRDVYDMLVLLRDEGIDKPALIAKRLNIPVANVYLARRQLATLILKFGKKEGQK
jgi:hypothetical protein